MLHELEMANPGFGVVFFGARGAAGSAVLKTLLSPLLLAP
jgi:hypothetical protein